MRYIIVLLLLISFGWTGCEEKVEVVSTPEEYKKKLVFPFNTPKIRDGVDLQDVRSRVKNVIKARQKAINDDLFDLTYYYITPFGFDNNRKRAGPENFVGLWLKFEKDFTYTYGRYEELIGSGIFHFTDKEELLLMLDDDPKVEPKFFSALSNSEFYNFIGRPINFIDDGKGVRMMFSDFANDGFIESVKMVAQLHNGMQIMLKMTETQPVNPKG